MQIRQLLGLTGYNNKAPYGAGELVAATMYEKGRRSTPLQELGPTGSEMYLNA